MIAENFVPERVSVNMDSRSPTFSQFQLQHGLLLAADENALPTSLSAWKDGELKLAENATHYVYVHAGSAKLKCRTGTYPLGEGLYAAVPGAGSISGQGRGMVVTRHGYLGLFQLGGPIEARGRLRYIDGCTDTLLIGPPVLGEPCFNHLHIPSSTHQTQHTHPSIRVGLIARGSGYCQLARDRVALHPGMAFCIQAEGLHSFHTGEESIDVVVYHPDSDHGPSHQDHPMINRTMVSGVSASRLEEYQTKI